MKKYFIGILAVVAAVGFSAFSPEAYKAKKGFTTYYAIRQGPGEWKWQTTTGGLECLEESGAPTCSYEALQQPADNSNPGGTHNMFYK